MTSKSYLLLYNTLSKGAGVCRNIGIKKAVGKWIIFADADDYFLPNMYLIMEKYINKIEDIIYFSPTSRDEKTKIESFRHLHHKKLIKEYLKNFDKDLLVYSLPEPWSKMIKRELIEKNKIYFSEVEVGNDKFFSVKAGYFSKKILVVEEIIYCVTYSKNSLTSNENKERLKIRLNESFKINDFMKKMKIKKKNEYPVIILLYKLSKYDLKLSLKYFYMCLIKKYKLFPQLDSILLSFFKRKKYD